MSTTPHRPHRRWAGASLLALSMVFLGAAPLPPAGATGPVPRPCGEARHNQWLSACAFALIAAARRDRPLPTDPWQVLSRDDVFESAPPLADHFVAACEQLEREPWRLAEVDRPDLARFGWPPLDRACTIAQHLAWLRGCEADVAAIVGRSRRDLLAVFGEEGGLSTTEQRDYVHRRCGALKVRAIFRPAGGGRAPDESPDDTVVQTTAYIDPYFVAD